MRGTVYKRIHQRKDGKTSVLYYGVISLPDGPGKRRKDWGHGYANRREAQSALTQKLLRFDAEPGLRTSDLELGAYLTEQWLPSTVDRIEATTFAGYERAVAHVLPRLDHVKLRNLTPSDLNLLYQDLRVRGGRSRDPRRSSERRPLRPATVRAVHVVVSKALGDAVELGLVHTNAAKRAKPPRVHLSLDIDPWTAEELVQFLEFVVNDPFYAVWRLAAFTGMRRGELLGLRWGDIDVEARTLAVRQARTMARRTVITSTPKSGHARVIDLDVDSATALAQLRSTIGQTESHDLVVRHPDGEPLHPDRLTQLFRKHVRHSGVRPIRLHDLRHTHASLLLAAGVPIKVVSERLGHADPAFTMRVYQHVLPGMQAAAAQAFATLVSTAGEARR